MITSCVGLLTSPEADLVEHEKHYTTGHYSRGKSIHLTLLETNATKLKPYKKIPDDKKNIFSINSTCERKDSEVCSDDTNVRFTYLKFDMLQSLPTDV